jgi:Protein of unknown function (DUF2637)
MTRQMVLPIAERPNGATSATAAPPTLSPEPVPALVSVPGADWVRRVTILAVVLVALVAAVGSYEHMRHLAGSVGEGWRAWLVPISVDGLAVAASMTMLTRRRAGLPAGGLAWTALLLALAASLAANVASAEPTWPGRLVAAWPPLGLLLSYELLMQQIKAPGRPGLETVAPGASNPFGRGSGDDVRDRA